MIKAGIIGSTGYAGNELVRLLMNHPEVEISGTAQEAMLMRSTLLYIRTCSTLWRTNVLMIISRKCLAKWM